MLFLIKMKMYAKHRCVYDALANSQFASLILLDQEGSSLT